MDARRITTERLVLRPLTEADRGPVAAILGDLRVSSMLARVPHPFGPDDVRITREDGTESWPEQKAIDHVGALIGIIGSRDHLGYWLAPEHWGQGLMSEALPAAVGHLFGVEDREEIESGHYVENPASGRLLERVGFRRNGETLMTSLATGREHRSLDYIMTRSDWEARA